MTSCCIVLRDPWRQLSDLDLLEGSSSDFVGHLQDQYGPNRLRLQLHEQFGTAELVLDGLRLDVAARTETYPAWREPSCPGRHSWQDLARRDFTVNAMTLVLNPMDPSIV